MLAFAAVLLAAYRASASELEGGRAVVPAAEWLLDNFHLLEGESRSVIHDLPTRYYRKLLQGSSIRASVRSTL